MSRDEAIMARLDERFSVAPRLLPVSGMPIPPASMAAINLSLAHLKASFGNGNGAGLKRRPGAGRPAIRRAQTSVVAA
jgi:hypothetical protein